MNQILLFENDVYLDPDLVVLEGRRASHIRQVLRAKKGDRLRVGLLNARSGTAEIAEITDREVHLKVGDLQEPPKSRTPGAAIHGGFWSAGVIPAQHPSHRSVPQESPFIRRQRPAL